MLPTASIRTTLSINITRAMFSITGRNYRLQNSGLAPDPSEKTATNAPPEDPRTDVSSKGDEASKPANAPTRSKRPDDKYLPNNPQKRTRILVACCTDCREIFFLNPAWTKRLFSSWFSNAHRQQAARVSYRTHSPNCFILLAVQIEASFMSPFPRSRRNFRLCGSFQASLNFSSPSYPTARGIIEIRWPLGSKPVMKILRENANVSVTVHGLKKRVRHNFP